jgi:hypothetical protein
MKATLTNLEPPSIPDKEGVFFFYRGKFPMHYTSAHNLRRGVHTALAYGWTPDSVVLVQTPRGLSLERYLRRIKWDGNGLESHIAAWEKWWSVREAPEADQGWETKLMAGGKLAPKCPEDPIGKKVWHRLAKAETKRLLEEIDRKPKV